MFRTHYSADVPKKEGEKVKVAGFVLNIRDMGKLKFMVLRDRSGEIQVTTKDEGIGDLIKSIPRESFVSVSGNVKESRQAPRGIEIIPEKVEVISQSETPLPVDISGKLDSNLDKRIDWRFLDMRNPAAMSVFLLQSSIVKYINHFMEENGFVRVFTSRLTCSATEGGTEYFPILYFEREAFLAQSPQLYKESVLLSGLDRVYDIGFVYRAEPHHTPRHLCEYVSFDVEMLASRLEEILDMEEAIIKYIFGKISEKNPEILAMHGSEIQVPGKIPRMTFDEANDVLRQMGVATEDSDLTPEGEREICRHCQEKFGTGLVFITEFPSRKKPFYTMKKPGSDKSWSFDLLFNGLEITSGGLREHRYGERVSNIKEKGMNPENYDHLRFWKYGMPPHGGFAIGIERLTMQLLGLKNVREATLLPRDPSRLTP